MADRARASWRAPLGLVLIGGLLRAVLMCYSRYHDAKLPVPYTDKDFFVYSAAAERLRAGGSPYDHVGYRYSPLLAALVLGAGPSGEGAKWLFVVADLAVGVLIWCTLRARAGCDKRTALAGSALWLLNPLVANISTRGSCDALEIGMVVGALACFERRLYGASGALYGLAVHFRVYPIIYAPSIALNLLSRPSKVQLGALIRFFSAAAAVFVGAGAVCYSAYGWTFVKRTYIYHASRVDHWHNMSPAFLGSYLEQAGKGSLIVLARAMAAAAQVVVVGAGAVTYGLGPRADLAFCWLLQTLAFVAFNRVVTAQYFLWYVGLLPLAYPSLPAARNAVPVLVAWAAAEVHWLYWGYRLEFRGESVFVQLWLAGLLFFAANVGVMVCLLFIFTPLAVSEHSIHTFLSLPTHSCS